MIVVAQLADGPSPPSFSEVLPPDPARDQLDDRARKVKEDCHACQEEHDGEQLGGRPFRPRVEAGEGGRDDGAVERRRPALVGEQDEPHRSDREHDDERDPRDEEAPEAEPMLHGVIVWRAAARHGRGTASRRRLICAVEELLAGHAARDGSLRGGSLIPGAASPSRRADPVELLRDRREGAGRRGRDANAFAHEGGLDLFARLVNPPLDGGKRDLERVREISVEESRRCPRSSSAILRSTFSPSTARQRASIASARSNGARRPTGADGMSSMLTRTYATRAPLEGVELVEDAVLRHLEQTAMS